MLAVVAVVAVFLGTRARQPAVRSASGGFELVFRAQPAAGVPAVSRKAVARTASMLAGLVAGLPGAGGRTAVRSSADRIVVEVGRGAGVGASELVSLVGLSGRFAFYDWEANALTPNGRIVASRLTAHDPAAMEISQGGSLPPGSPGGGSMSLYQAVKLASQQPRRISSDNGRVGPEYFLFGIPGQGVCGAAESNYATRIGRAPFCYLAGPTATADQARAALPEGVSPAQTRLLLVPQGTVVLEAVSRNFDHPLALSDPAAQFYVLRDHVALWGSEITHPTPSTDQAGSPDVRVGFTPQGVAAFEKVTRQVAERGDLVSVFGETLEQHFAVALGDRLITVPAIDFKTYPVGVPGRAGAEITAGLTARWAEDLARKEFLLGTLPLTLQLISSSAVGAS